MGELISLVDLFGEQPVQLSLDDLPMQLTIEDALDQIAAPAAGDVLVEVDVPVVTGRDHVRPAVEWREPLFMAPTTSQEGLGE